MDEPEYAIKKISLKPISKKSRYENREAMQVELKHGFMLTKKDE